MDPDDTQSMNKSQLILMNRDKSRPSPAHSRSVSKKKLGNSKLAERKMFHNPSVVHIKRSGLLSQSAEETESSGAKSFKIRNKVIQSQVDMKVPAESSIETER